MASRKNTKPRVVDDGELPVNDEQLTIGEEANNSLEDSFQLVKEGKEFINDYYEKHAGSGQRIVMVHIIILVLITCVFLLFVGFPKEDYTSPRHHLYKMNILLNAVQQNWKRQYIFGIKWSNSNHRPEFEHITNNSTIFTQTTSLQGKI